MDPVVKGHQQTTQVYTSMQGLANMRREARNNSEAALQQVARQFEAIFMQMMMKSMRDANMGDPLFDSSQSKMFTDLHDKQITMQMSSKGGIGLADMIVNQLKGNLPGAKVPAQAADAGKSLVVPGELLKKIQAGAEKGGQSVDNAKLLLQLKKQLGFRKSQAAGSDTGVQPGKASSTNEAGTEKAVKGTGPRSPEEFVRSIWGQVRSIGKKLGVNPVAILAQTVLETGWGKHMPKHGNGNSSNNLFGIKAHSQWRGKSLVAQTREVVNGKSVEKNEKFKSYETVGAALQDFAAMLKGNPRYAGVLKAGQSIKAYFAEIQKSGYATDPKYADKLNAIAGGKTLQNILKKVL